MATPEPSPATNITEVVEPLDLSIALAATDSTAASLVQGAPATDSTTYFKNISIPVPDDPPLALTQHQQPPIAASSTSSGPCPSNIPALTAASDLEIGPTDVSIDESSSRVAVRIVLKKSKRFCGAIRLYLNKSAASNCNKLKSLVSSLKDWFKNGNQLTSSLMKTFKGQSLSQCLRFLGLPINSNHQQGIGGSGKRKKSKGHHHQDHAAGSGAPIKCSNWIQKFSNGTLLNLMKKPELPELAGFQFAKPKVYQCGYCDTRFYKMPLYLKHIRRHAALIRCESCDKAFSSSLNHKRHQVQCKKRKLPPTI